ncbi:MAG: hypothetical protein ACHQD9_03395, partial [Chitinophagales bacterium]
FYIWAYVVFRKSGYPQILYIIMLGATITLFTIFMFNLFRKVSAHAGASGAFFVVTLIACLLTSANFNYLPVIIVLVAGVVGSSRLILNAHDNYEVFAGYLIGMIGQMVAMRFY